MAVNAFLIRWEGGWAYREDAGSVGDVGGIEALLGLGALNSISEVNRVADGQLTAFAHERVQTDIAIAPVDDTDTPYLAFNVGDYITVQGDSHRVLGLTVTEDVETGRLLFVPTLNEDVVLGQDERVFQAMRKMINGTLGGRSKVAQPVVPQYVPRGLIGEETSGQYTFAPGNSLSGPNNSDPTSANLLGLTEPLAGEINIPVPEDFDIKVHVTADFRVYNYGDDPGGTPGSTPGFNVTGVSLERGYGPPDVFYSDATTRAVPAGNYPGAFVDFSVGGLFTITPADLAGTNPLWLTYTLTTDAPGTTFRLVSSDGSANYQIPGRVDP